MRASCSCQTLGRISTTRRLGGFETIRKERTLKPMDVRPLSDDESRKLKAVQLDILLEISSVCRELGIEFVLDGGTLLGAARHEGFIPWDDDIDIGMMRDDYEIFLSQAPQLLDGRYLLQAPQTDPRVQESFAKVRKKGTLLVERNNYAMSYNRGIWVDIFPYDVVDASPRSIARQKRRWRFWSKLHGWRSSSIAGASRGRVAQIAKKAVNGILSVAPLEAYRTALDKIAIPPKSNGGHRAVTCFHYFTVFFVLPEEDTHPLTTLPFEGYEMPVFANWETYLEKVYGDWRQLPPEDKRRGHDIVVIDFGKNEK